MHARDASATAGHFQPVITVAGWVFDHFQPRSIVHWTARLLMCSARIDKAGHWTDRVAISFDSLSSMILLFRRGDFKIRRRPRCCAARLVVSCKLLALGSCR